jgi:hypothetical protein
MNVLILTPDRVGSTLLQRLVTVYSVINENHNPLTVNLHELTNGLAYEYNDVFKQKLLGKKQSSWGYHQSLETIVGLLKSADHDVVSRLAFYHLRNRQDNLNDQLEFYRYLNENFYIISARRKNLFEHTMSWCIAAESKKLNVYSHEEKFNTFKTINQHGFLVQAESMDKYLNQYQEYLDWVDRHFNVNRYFEYESDLQNLEEFILSLTPFSKYNNPLRWQDRFDISWQDWNRIHYLLSLEPFDYRYSAEEDEFLKENLDLYRAARIQLQDWQDQGILVSGIPIKLHTLQEKAKIITNIDQCLLHYNSWIAKTQPVNAVSYSPEMLTNTAELEFSKWKSAQGNLQLGIDWQNLQSADLKFE